ncbi:MAG: PDZ domain-containing protein [Anaerolineae bacterium]|nr:PDZ domain-containing protein [Anaerolineae bacterium]NIN93850.1 PDZ domain-containing protein [Anaerolineae bacterium]NIQ76885.1 PDZ domain-containing protein [Anaerolineae bacterium]
MTKRKALAVGLGVTVTLAVGLCLIAAGALAGWRLYSQSGSVVPKVWAAVRTTAEAEEGILVAGVDEDSPAEEAGISRGDIIVAFDGEEIDGAGHLQKLLSERSPGDTVTLTLKRCDETVDVSVTLGTRGISCSGACAYLGVLPCRVPLTVRVPGPTPFLIPGLDAWNQGALVIVVQEGSPAEEAGLQEGDIILAVDDEEVSPQDTLRELIRAHDVGDTVELQIEREGEERTLTATLDEDPDEEGAAYLGVRVTPFPRGIGFLRKGEGRVPLLPHLEGFPVVPGVEILPRGLLVIRVAANSPAEEAGLSTGDIILDVDGEEVSDFDILREAVRAGEPGDDLTLSVLRDGEEREISITLGEHPDEEGTAYLGITGYGYSGSSEPGTHFHFHFDADELWPPDWWPWSESEPSEGSILTWWEHNVPRL